MSKRTEEALTRLEAHRDALALDYAALGEDCVTISRSGRAYRLTDGRHSRYEDNEGAAHDALAEWNEWVKEECLDD